MGIPVGALVTDDFDSKRGLASSHNRKVQTLLRVFPVPGIRRHCPLELTIHKLMLSPPHRSIIATKWKI